MKYLKTFESFVFNENENDLEELKKKYPNAELILTPHERFKDSFYAKLDIIKQDGSKETIEALRGPVSKEQAYEFFNHTLLQNYDKFY